MRKQQKQQILNFQGLSIRVKFSFVVLFATVTALVTTGWVNHQHSQAELKRAIESRLLTTALQANHVLQVMKQNQDRLALISSRTQLRLSLDFIGRQSKDNTRREHHFAKIKKILQDACAASPGVLSLTVTDQKGQKLASTNEDDTFDPSVYAWHSFDNQLPIQVAVKQDAQHPISILYSDFLVLEGRVVGTLYLESTSTDLNTASKIPHDSLLEEETFLVYLDQNKSVRRVFSQHSETSGVHNVINPFKAVERGEKGLFLTVDRNGVEVFAVAQVIPQMKWGIVYKISKRAALAPVIARRNFLIASLLIAALASVLVASLFAGTVTQPIVDLTSVAILIAEGDLTRRINLLSDDELGLLAQAFNQMADNLIEANVLLEERVRRKTKEIVIINEKLSRANHELTQITLEDPLTGLANRRAFDQTFSKEWKRCSRDQKPLALILVDIDFFKLYNDLAGHRSGDTCLQKVAEVLKNQARRESDLIARYGGEEFVFVIPGSSQEDAVGLANRTIQAMLQKAIPHPGSPISEFVTLSLGVGAVVPHSKLEPEAFFEKIDQALYAAKEGGRHRFSEIKEDSADSGSAVTKAKSTGGSPM